jgi:hypothetical protein
MLQELFYKLKVEWEHLGTDTKKWISCLEGKGEGPDAETNAARESLSIKKSFVTATDQQMQRAKSDNDVEVRDAATRMQSYLENTESLHEELTQRSQGDAEAEDYASSVQKSREAVAEQVKAIHEATSVKLLTPTVVEQAGTGATQPGSGSSPRSTGVIAPPVQDKDTQESSIGNPDLAAWIQDMDSIMQKYSTSTAPAPGGAMPAPSSQSQTSTQAWFQSVLGSGGAQPPPSSQPTTPPMPGLGQPLASPGAGQPPPSTSVPASLITGQSVDVLFWLRGQKKEVIQLTEKLLKGPLEKPKDQKRLAKLTVDRLITAWKKAVDKLVKQVTSSLATGTISGPEQVTVMISALVFVHKQLQTLYNNLNATVIEQQPVTIQF